MTIRLARPLLAALCLAACAQTATAGDLIPTADFARRAPITDPALSPDGQYVSVSYHDGDGKTNGIAIYRVTDMTNPTTLIRMPPYEMPADMVWASNTRLVVERGKVDGSIGSVSGTGELMAIDVNGKNADYLFGYENVGKRSGTRAIDRGWGSIVGTPPQTNGHFYMRATLWNSQDRSSLYDMDATTSTRKQLADIGLPGLHFMMAADGTPRFATGVDENYRHVVLHRDANGAWTKVKADPEHEWFQPVAQVADGKRMYAMYSPHGKGGELVEQDEDGGNPRTIRRDEFSEVTTDGFWTPAPLRPFGTWSETGVPSVTYVDPQEPIARLHMALAQKFPGEFVRFIDYNEDGSLLMFKVSSDRDPGRVMLISTKTYKVSSLFNALPWIDPAKMAERRPVRFKASDGMELEAILTLPKGKPEKDLPMVLLPHGGPHGIRDDWFYDTDAQFLANRGYLVMQVNYRGSGGRGAAFEAAGFRHWGSRVQDDLADGVKWVISQGYANASRVCVFGASFGGYSALMAPIRDPGMFKCAVGYAGIYDLAMMHDKGDIKSSKYGRGYLDEAIGNDTAELTQFSPAKRAGELNIPIMLVHGEDDERAPFAQYKAMKAALEAAHQSVETLTKPGERHGFVKPENVVEFYDKLAAFLDKNIGEGAATKAAAP